MLVLTRYHGQKILIHDLLHGGRIEIEVKTEGKNRGRVRLAMDAPERFRIMRDELFERVPGVEDGL